MKRVGPELKMPDLGKAKVPGVVADLYYDLRDRRLLPLVALILAAIVAAPFLLGETEEPVKAPPPAVGGTLEGAEPSSLTVAKAQPGLRDYRKRLDGHTPTDPFKQRFTGPPGGSDTTETTASTSSGGSGGSGGEATSVPPPSSEPVESFPAPVPTSPPSGGGGREDADDDGIPDGSTLYTYVLDLEITRIETKPDGSLKQIGPKLRKNVEAPTALPGEKAPVVTYLGLGAKEPRRPLFLISPDVTAVYGEAECVAGTDTCQLIALEPTFAVTFVYGENNVRYKINVLDVTPKPIDPPK